MPAEPWVSAREQLRAKLAVPFDGYENPAKPLILGLRKAYLQHGVRPEGAMQAWLEGSQPPGMRKLPVPEVDRRSAWLFRRLVAERAALPEHPMPVGSAREADDTFRSRWLRNALTAALNEIPLQMIDPEWDFGPKFVDIAWPNQIDLEFTQNQGKAEFYAAGFAARSNLSYLIVMGQDDRISASVKWKRPEPEIDSEPSGGMAPR